MKMKFMKGKSQSSKKTAKTKTGKLS